MERLCLLEGLTGSVAVLDYTGLVEGWGRGLHRSFMLPLKTSDQKQACGICVKDRSLYANNAPELSHVTAV